MHTHTCTHASEQESKSVNHEWLNYFWYCRSVAWWCQRLLVAATWPIECRVSRSGRPSLTSAAACTTTMECCRFVLPLSTALSTGWRKPGRNSQNRYIIQLHRSQECLKCCRFCWNFIGFVVKKKSADMKPEKYCNFWPTSCCGAFGRCNMANRVYWNWTQITINYHIRALAADKAQHPRGKCHWQNIKTWRTEKKKKQTLKIKNQM